MDDLTVILVPSPMSPNGNLSYEIVAEELKKKGLEVHIVESVGSLSSLIKETEQVVEKAGKTVIVGESISGQLAMKVLQEMPDNVEYVICLDCNPMGTPDATREVFGSKILNLQWQEEQGIIDLKKESDGGTNLAIEEMKKMRMWFQESSAQADAETFGQDAERTLQAQHEYVEAMKSIGISQLMKNLRTVLSELELVVVDPNTIKNVLYVISAVPSAWCLHLPGNLKEVHDCWHLVALERPHETANLIAKAIEEL